MQGKLTIAKNNLDLIVIRVQDNTSNINCIEIKTDIENFAEALFGVGFQKCDFSLKGTDVIGKKRIIEDLIFQVNTWGDKEEAKTRALEAIKNTEWADWSVSLNFNKQDSFFIKDNKTYAQTYMYKYVAITE